MEATNLADLYGTPLLDWGRIKGRLDQGLSQAPETGGPNRHTCWLTTINRDGSPHVTGVGALWVDDAFWFETGEGTRKGKNLAADPRCVLSVASHDFDLVVEGEAHKVTDPSTVAPWRSAGPQRAGRRASTTRVWRSPPSTAPHRPGRRRGTCIASRRAPRQHS